MSQFDVPGSVPGEASGSLRRAKQSAWTSGPSEDGPKSPKRPACFQIQDAPKLAQISVLAESPVVPLCSSGKTSTKQGNFSMAEEIAEDDAEDGKLEQLKRHASAKLLQSCAFLERDVEQAILKHRKELEQMLASIEQDNPKTPASSGDVFQSPVSVASFEEASIQTKHRKVCEKDAGSRILGSKGAQETRGSQISTISTNSTKQSKFAVKVNARKSIAHNLSYVFSAAVDNIGFHADGKKSKKPKLMFSSGPAMDVIEENDDEITQLDSTDGPGSVRATHIVPQDPTGRNHTVWSDAVPVRTTNLAGIDNDESLKRKMLAEELHRTASNISGLHEKPENLLQRIVHSKAFDACFIIFILINAMLAGVRSELPSTKQDEIWDISIANALFTFAFLLELVARVLAHGCNAFVYSVDAVWNLFDVLLVLVSCVDFIMHNVFFRDSAAGSGSTLTVICLLRALRLVRFVAPLRVLLKMIFSTLRTLIWALIMLASIIYGFAVVFTQAAIQELATDSMTREERDGLFKYFGTLGRSFYTLFMAMSGGLDWGGPAQVLGDAQAALLVLMVIFISFVFFAFLNTVTGLVCHKAMESARRDEEEMATQRLRDKKYFTATLSKIFARVDTHSTGVMTLWDFEEALETEDIQACFAALDLDITDAFDLFKLIDNDVDGQVEVQEFIEGCLRFRGPATSMDIAQLDASNKMLSKKMNHILSVLSNSSPTGALISANSGMFKIRKTKAIV